MRRALAAGRAFAVTLLFFTLAGIALAQSGGGYTVRRHTLDAGGARMHGPNVVVHGTVGQPDAGAMTGAPGYVLRGGFWVAAATIEREDALFADGFE